MGRNFLGGGGPPPFWEGERGPHLAQVACDEAYLHTKWHLNLCSHLAATDMGRICPYLTQHGQGRGLPACQV